MKKFTMLISALLCAAALSSCGGAQEAANDIDTAAVAAILDETVHFSEQLTEVSKDMLMRRYGLDESVVEDAAGYAGTKAVVDEIAVFKTSDTAAVEEAVNARIESQKTNYSSYAPDEVPKLEDAVVKTGGNCVVLCVSNDPSETVSGIISELMSE